MHRSFAVGLDHGTESLLHLPGYDVLWAVDLQCVAKPLLPMSGWQVTTIPPSHLHATDFLLGFTGNLSLKIVTIFLMMIVSYTSENRTTRI
jgi:hypothetical protein